MEDDVIRNDTADADGKENDVVYNPDKDFYKGMSGELRFKAEGLFKKAREKGISIEEIEVLVLRENSAEFPGLPAFLVKVKGKGIANGQVIVDGKQVDYYNMYQKHISEIVENKNLLKDEKGKIVKENGKPKIKHDLEMFLTEWERFEIGKDLVDEKEFGLEKTITGACDRVIRKLMGENDWLYPGEAKLLDEEFSNVQARIQEQEIKKQTAASPMKKATERQINYLKAKVKNLGMDPDDNNIMREIIKQAGYEATDATELSTQDMSRIIDNITAIISRVKESLTRQNFTPLFEQNQYKSEARDIKQ